MITGCININKFNKSVSNVLVMVIINNGSLIEKYTDCFRLNHLCSIIHWPYPFYWSILPHVIGKALPQAIRKISGMTGHESPHG